MMKGFVIRIEIPALSELVNLLRQQNRDQQRIEEAAAAVTELTCKLRRGTTELREIINQAKQ